MRHIACVIDRNIECLKMNDDRGPRSLAPLDYHENVVVHLRNEERHAWEWSSSGALTQEVGEIRDTMLRDTYRLEQAGHPHIFDACHAAMARLGIEAPVTLYQANDGTMNASLVYVPGEIHLVFFGPILEKLDNAELLALMGHELSHFLLWSMGDGEYYRASRVFDHALSYPRSEEHTSELQSPM